MLRRLDPIALIRKNRGRSDIDVEQQLAPGGVAVALTSLSGGHNSSDVHRVHPHIEVATVHDLHPPAQPHGTSEIEKVLRARYTSSLSDGYSMITECIGDR